MNDEQINNYSNAYSSYPVTGNNRLIPSRSLIVKVVVLAVIVTVGLVTDAILNGGATYIKLPSAPPILGQATQSQVNKINNVKKSSNYTLQNTHSFYSGNWIVTNLTPTGNTGGQTIVVMEKIGQFYQTVLGPGTSFPSNVTQGLPSDVSSYLNRTGAVYSNNESL